jgi:hypothetical protein
MVDGNEPDVIVAVLVPSGTIVYVRDEQKHAVGLHDEQEAKKQFPSRSCDRWIKAPRS